MIDRDSIIISNLKYVKNIAYNFKLDTLSFMDYDDLMSIGIIGLVNAVITYDETKNMKFKNYALLKIKGAIIDEFRKGSLIPINKYNQIKLYFNSIEELKKEGSLSLSKSNISKKMNISIKEVEQIESNIYFINTVSLDYIKNEDENSFYNIKGNELTPEEHYFKKYELTFLNKALRSLHKNEKEVIYLYYFMGLNLKEIGTKLNLSEGRISQINKKALNNLKKIYKESYESN